MTTAPVPLYIDTDLGTDVDDALALSLAALDPRFDLRRWTKFVQGRVLLHDPLCVLDVVDDDVAQKQTMALSLEGSRRLAVLRRCTARQGGIGHPKRR